jgi:3',5'-cyclic AMP phosphodiesterase CpdA
MPNMKQFRTRDASLWQSAVDEVVAKENTASSPAAGFGGGTPAVKRPFQGEPEIEHSNDIAEAVNNGEPVPTVPPPSPAAGAADTVKFCATAAFKLAEARVKAFFTHDDTELKRLEEELKTPFGNCDAKWAQVLAVYAASKINAKTRDIPYIRHKNLNDFVLTDRLPDQATIALLGDWGTGQEAARKLLTKIASKKPDAVFHLGDVYYSGTENEVKNYFYAIWQKVLGIPKVAWDSPLTDTAAKPATFHLSGNHDMYAGGGPYYSVIKMLGQPASYFCVRNKDWQFIALDTGLHDSNPVAQGSATFLEDTEVEWLKDKIANAGGRKTVLLSHHQLFSASDKINGSSVNEQLNAQVKDVLPQVTAWLWGHEHNLVVYRKFQNVLGRCVGHGAFPVAVDQTEELSPDVPIEDVHLDKDQTGGLFLHGYALLKLDGKNATATYFQYNSDTDEEVVKHTETL